MSWVVVGMAAVGAVQGAEQRSAQKKANKAQADAAAAQTEFSPWTKAGPGQLNQQAVTGSALGGAVQGGLAGAMYSKKNPAEGAKPTAEMQQGMNEVNAPTGNAPMMVSDNPMGAEQMAEQERLRKMKMGGGFGGGGNMYG